MWKILIVDDEYQICEHLAELLTSFGYSAGFILHPKLLFPRLENEKFDLILLDINMPDINGVTLLGQIKNHQDYKNIPVVVLTGEVSDKLLAQCFEGGAEDFINKPISELVLKARVQSVLATQSYIKEIQNQRNQMREELAIAEEAQRSILSTVPVIPFLETYLHYDPLGNVSGDTYDLSINKEGAFDIFLGDGTGHGVSAAFITMMVQMELHNIRRDLPTHEIIREINLHLSTCVPGNRFMTGIYMRISEDGLISTTNAGNPPPMIIPADGTEVIYLVKGGQGLGMFEEELIPYSEKTYQLRENDKVCIYTDGIYEWRNKKGSIFGLKAVEKFLSKNREMKIDLLINQLLKNIKEYSQETRRNDDITIIGFEYKNLKKDKK